VRPDALVGKVNRDGLSDADHSRLGRAVHKAVRRTCRGMMLKDGQTKATPLTLEATLDMLMMDAPPWASICDKVSARLVANRSMQMIGLV
jgi:LmbE family N-acetylglucosaminyl deacetylase